MGDGDGDALNAHFSLSLWTQGCSTVLKKKKIADSYRCGPSIEAHLLQTLKRGDCQTPPFMTQCLAHFQRKNSIKIQP